MINNPINAATLKPGQRLHLPADSIIIGTIPKGVQIQAEGDLRIDGNLGPQVTIVCQGDLGFDSTGSNCAISAAGRIRFNRLAPQCLVKGSWIHGNEVGDASQIEAVADSIRLETVGSGVTLVARTEINFETCKTNCNIKTDGAIHFSTAGNHSKLTAASIKGDDVGNNAKLECRQGDLLLSGTVGNFVQLSASGDIWFYSAGEKCIAHAKGKITLGAAGNLAELKGSAIEGDKTHIGDNATLTSTQGDIDLEGGTLGRAVMLNSNRDIRFGLAGPGCQAKAEVAIVFDSTGDNSQLHGKLVEGKTFGTGTKIFDEQHPTGYRIEPQRLLSMGEGAPSGSTATHVNPQTAERAATALHQAVEEEAGCGIRYQPASKTYVIPKTLCYEHDREMLDIIIGLGEHGASVVSPKAGDTEQLYRISPPSEGGKACEQMIRTCMTDFIAAHKEQAR